MALTKIGTDGVKDDAVTSDKVANSINTAIAANTAKTQTTINNNADNRVITGSGTANTLEGESGLTYTGQALNVNSVTSEGNAFRIYNTTDNSTRFHINGEGDYFTGNSYPRSDANMDLGFRSGYRWRDLILSGGVQLGGTGTANLLDDYEEGTFTPYLGGTSNSGTYSVTGTGTYIKIGNKVTVSIRFNNVNLDDNAAGDVLIFNMPFSAGHAPTDGVSGTTGDVSYYNVGLNAGNEHRWYISSGSTTWYGLSSRPSASWDSFPVSAFHSSATYINFFGTYFT